MLSPKRQNLFPPFATTFDGDSAECSKHLGRARGILSLMCRSVPPVKSRIETTADGVEIRVTTNPNHVYIKAGGSTVYITYTDWKSPLISGEYDIPPYNFGRRDRFVHKNRKLITKEPTPLVPPNRTMDLPRFDPVVKTDFYAGKKFWISKDKKTVVSWYKDTVFSAGAIIKTKTNSLIICCCFNEILGSFIIVYKNIILNTYHILRAATDEESQINIVIESGSFLQNTDILILSSIEVDETKAVRKLKFSSDYSSIEDNSVIETHEDHIYCEYFFNESHVICAYNVLTSVTEPESTSGYTTETFVTVKSGYDAETDTYWKEGYVWLTSTSVTNYGDIVSLSINSGTNKNALTVLKINSNGLVSSGTPLIANGHVNIDGTYSGSSNPYAPNGSRLTWHSWESEENASMAIIPVDFSIPDATSNLQTLGEGKAEYLSIFFIQDINKIFYNKTEFSTVQSKINGVITSSQSSSSTTLVNNSVIWSAGSSSNYDYLAPDSTASISFLDGVFDGVMAAGCGSYYPFPNPKIDYSHIVNVKTNKTQTLNYKICNSDSYYFPLSVTTLPEDL